MKIRQGFVSNSSSSSFICGMCGYNVEGRYLSSEDAVSTIVKTVMKFVVIV